MYLDHAATTAMRPEAVSAYLRGIEEANANASGTHGAARAAKNALEQARERAAELLGSSRPAEIVFTPGGPASDNIGVSGAAPAADGSDVLVSAI